MDVLIELLFDNIIFLFVIIAGLVSFINRLMTSNNRGEEQSAGKGQEGQGGGTGRQTVREVMRRMQEMAESLDPETAESQRRTAEQPTVDEPVKQTSSEGRTTAPAYSFEQQRNEQFKRLQKQYESMAQSEHTDLELDPESPIFKDTHAATIRAETQTYRSKKDKAIDLKSRLNADGLIESVIMAEVLGPPRARKRYSNRYLER